MKANRHAPTPCAAWTAVCAAAALLAGCAGERQTAPASPPTRTARVAPPPPPAAPPPADWRDAPITPGTWLYRGESGGSAALFTPGAGEALLALRCDRVAGQVTLARAGAAQGAVPLTTTTTTVGRTFSATAQPGAAPRLVVALAPRDPLLDAIAFTRGRFAVEAPGLPTLYLPAAPEIGRVIEDCR